MQETITYAWQGLEELRPILRQFMQRRCRDGHELDDVVQETLMRAARYRGELQRGDALRGWTIRIAVNVLRDLIRRERRMPRMESGHDLLAGLPGEDQGPGEAHSTRIVLDGREHTVPEVLEMLSEVREELEAEEREVLDAYYVGESRCAEIAHACDLPTPLVKVRLFRARQKLLRTLRSRLQEEEELEAARAAMTARRKVRLACSGARRGGSRAGLPAGGEGGGLAAGRGGT